MFCVLRRVWILKVIDVLGYWHSEEYIVQAVNVSLFSPIRTVWVGVQLIAPAVDRLFVHHFCLIMLRRF